MLSVTTVVLSVFLLRTYSAEDLTFPPGFKFGVSSSAYQVEGAWNVSDKGESIWDRHAHNNLDKIADHSTGDVACDSYHLLERDLEIISELGVHFYRFSISWARLLPTGRTNYVSEDAKRYYNGLIDGLLARGVEPMVTIYHWELPQKLQDLGGWANPLIANWFEEYSRLLYTLYGDRVKTWITINEPTIVCDLAYNIGWFAPGLLVPDVGYLICSKNVLLAHARAWRVYHEEFRPKWNGRVGMSMNLIWMEANSPEDEDATEMILQLMEGRFSHPIFSEAGGWPPALEKLFEARSKKLGYPRSILPKLTDAEVKLIKGTYDFYGINMYTSRIVMRAQEGQTLQPWPIDSPEVGVKLEQNPHWELSSAPYLPIYPEGFRKMLVWLKNTYGDIEFIVTENGYPGPQGLNDSGRIRYHKNHMKQMLLAIKEDEVNVTAYTVWSIMDNFEWMAGYSIKFGLYEVDFTSKQLTRTPRASALYYASVIKNHSLDVPDDITVGEVNLSNPAVSPSVRNLLILGGVLLVIIAAVIIFKVKSNRAAVRRPSYMSCNTEENGNVKNKTVD